MKPSLTIVKIVLTVAIIVSIGTALGATIYFGMLKNNPPIAVQPTPSITQVLTPTATPTLTPTITPNIDISDWKTYRNEKYGFEFKYPSDYVIDELIINNKNFTNLWDKNSYDMYKTGKYSYASPFLWITVETLNGLTLEKWIESKKTDISEKEYVTFGNLKFLMVYEQGEGVGVYLYRIVKDNNVLTIGTGIAKINPTLNKILSTFELIDEINQVYKLDCANKPDSFQSKYSWYENFNNQIGKDWKLDTICYNEELKNIIYFTHYLKGQHFSDELVQMRVYDIKNNINNKEVEMSESQCRKINKWSKNGDIIYECDSSGPAVVRISTYLYNTNTKNNKLIDSCGIGNNDTNYLKTCEDERKKEYFN